MDISRATTILVQSDSCKSQYKSAKHFHHLQMLADKKEKQVLRVWTIAGHGRGEVDHVGGVAKIPITNDYFFDKTSEMVSYWSD